MRNEVILMKFFNIKEKTHFVFSYEDRVKKLNDKDSEVRTCHHIWQGSEKREEHSYDYLERLVMFN